MELSTATSPKKASASKLHISPLPFINSTTIPGEPQQHHEELSSEALLSTLIDSSILLSQGVISQEESIHTSLLPSLSSSSVTSSSITDFHHESGMVFDTPLTSSAASLSSSTVQSMMGLEMDEGPDEATALSILSHEDHGEASLTAAAAAAATGILDPSLFALLLQNIQSTASSSHVTDDVCGVEEELVSGEVEVGASLGMHVDESTMEDSAESSLSESSHNHANDGMMVSMEDVETSLCLGSSILSEADVDEDAAAIDTLTELTLKRKRKAEKPKEKRAKIKLTLKLPPLAVVQAAAAAAAASASSSVSDIDVSETVECSADGVFSVDNTAEEVSSKAKSKSKSKLGAKKSFTEVNAVDVSESDVSKKKSKKKKSVVSDLEPEGEVDPEPQFQPTVADAEVEADVAVEDDQKKKKKKKKSVSLSAESTTEAIEMMEDVGVEPTGASVAVADVSQAEFEEPALASAVKKPKRKYTKRKDTTADVSDNVATTSDSTDVDNTTATPAPSTTTGADTQPSESTDPPILPQRRLRLKTLKVVDAVSGETRYVCPVCSREYKNANGIKYHLNHMHLDDSELPDYVLEPPSERDRERERLLLAMGGEAGEYGGERGAYGEGAFIGEYIEVNERPYACEVEGCGKTYKNLNGLKVSVFRCIKGE
jgi:uncharacterized C2H2 Zn-finger protein